MAAVDDVFRALADPGRRSLLDGLFEADGQATSALEQRLPAMSRFGVMKHLRVLEDAGLVTSTKRGRERLWFLNPVPIRLVHDRWVSKYAEPWAAALAGLKRSIEEEEQDVKVFEVYIQASPERVWQGITDGELTRQYYFGSTISSDWRKGSRFEMVSPDGSEIWVEGDVLEIDPPRRLVQSFSAHWDAAMDQQSPSRVTWELEATGPSTRLRVTHEELTEAAADQVTMGWPQILSGLKTLLETGEPLEVGAAG